MLFHLLSIAWAHGRHVPYFASSLVGLCHLVSFHEVDVDRRLHQWCCKSHSIDFVVLVGIHYYRIFVWRRWLAHDLVSLAGLHQDLVLLKRGSLHCSLVVVRTVGLSKLVPILLDGVLLSKSWWTLSRWICICFRFDLDEVGVLDALILDVGPRLGGVDAWTLFGDVWMLLLHALAHQIVFGAGVDGATGTLSWLCIWNGIFVGRILVHQSFLASEKTWLQVWFAFLLQLFLLGRRHDLLASYSNRRSALVLTLLSVVVVTVHWLLHHTSLIVRLILHLLIRGIIYTHSVHFVWWRGSNRIHLARHTSSRAILDTLVIHAVFLHVMGVVHQHFVGAGVKLLILAELLLMQSIQHTLILVVLELGNQVLLFLLLSLALRDRWFVVAGLFGVLLLLLVDEHLEIVVLGRIRSTVWIHFWI